MRRFAGIVALAGLVVVAAFLPRPGPTAVTSFPEPTTPVDEATGRASIWYCPWAESGSGVAAVFGLVSLRPGTAEFTLPAPAAAGDVPADQFEITLGGPDAAAVFASEISVRASAPGYVEFDDGPATAGVLVSGDDLLSADLCLTSSPKVWHLAGISTRIDQQATLRLFNPFPENALVALSGVSEFGIVAMTDIATVDVPARSWVDIDLDVELPSFDQLALTIRAERGIVLPAAALEGETDTAWWPASGLSTDWWFPGAVFPGFAGELAVTNPGDEPATIVIDLHTPDGLGAGAATITIPPNEPTRVNLAELAAGAFGVRLRADRSIAAVVVGDGSAGVAATTGARAAAVRWLLPGAGSAVDAVTTLWVLNPFDEQATVTIQALGPDTPPAEKVIIGPGAVRQIVAAGPGTTGYFVEGSTPLVVSWSAQAPRGIALTAAVPVGN
jgi:hypothetical protein